MATLTCLMLLRSISAKAWIMYFRLLILHPVLRQLFREVSISSPSWPSTMLPPSRLYSATTSLSSMGRTRPPCSKYSKRKVMCPRPAITQSPSQSFASIGVGMGVLAMSLSKSHWAGTAGRALSTAANLMLRVSRTAGVFPSL